MKKAMLCFSLRRPDLDSPSSYYISQASRESWMTGKGKEKFIFSPRPNQAAQIRWRGWSSQALRLSREQGKPILLVISASWCHWCHVMDETCFSDPEVIQLINSRFIPVRVDSGRRPDINSRYNQSGWPTLAFLTHEGEVVASTTYIPTEQLKRLLTDIADLCGSSANKVKEAVREIQRLRQERPQARPEEPGPQVISDVLEVMRPEEPGPQVISDVLEVIGESYDREYGGFGWESKFPYADALAFLLTTLADGYLEAVDNMLRTTLDAMSAGGMYDRVEGGFFRYSTARDWSVPHYEKMLADNAALMAVYANAFLLTGEEGYKSVAKDVCSYLRAVLLDRQTGAFAGSQDADEHEHYYSLGAAKRANNKAPRLDRAVYTDQNAAAASALLRMFQIFDDPEYRSMAAAALDFVWWRLWDSESGPSHYYEDAKPRLSGQLADASSLLSACMDSFL